MVSTSGRFESAVRSALSLYDASPAVTITCVAEPQPLGPVMGLLSLVPSLAGQAVLGLLGDEY